MSRVTGGKYLPKGKSLIHAEFTKHSVGFCGFPEHAGCLNARALKEHNCIGKKCRYFHKYPNHPYWTERPQGKNKNKSAWQALKKLYNDSPLYCSPIRYSVFQKMCEQQFDRTDKNPCKIVESFSWQKFCSYHWAELKKYGLLHKMTQYAVLQEKEEG